MIAGGNEIRAFRIFRNRDGSNAAYIGVKEPTGKTEDTYEVIDQNRDGRLDQITNTMGNVLSMPEVVRHAQRYFENALISSNKLLEDLKKAIQTKTLIAGSEGPYGYQQNLYFQSRSGQRVSVVRSNACTRDGAYSYIVLETTSGSHFSVFVDYNRLDSGIQKAIETFPPRMDDSCD